MLQLAPTGFPSQNICTPGDGTYEPGPANYTIEENKHVKWNQQTVGNTAIDCAQASERILECSRRFDGQVLRFCGCLASETLQNMGLAEMREILRRMDFVTVQWSSGKKEMFAKGE